MVQTTEQASSIIGAKGTSSCLILLMHLPGEEKANVGWGNSATAWNLIHLDAFHKNKTATEGFCYFFLSLVRAQSWTDVRRNKSPPLQGLMEPPKDYIKLFSRAYVLF